MVLLETLYISIGRCVGIGGKRRNKKNAVTGKLVDLGKPVTSADILHSAGVCYQDETFLRCHRQAGKKKHSGKNSCKRPKPTTHGCLPFSSRAEILPAARGLLSVVRRTLGKV